MVAQKLPGGGYREADCEKVSGILHWGRAAMAGRGGDDVKLVVSYLKSKDVLQVRKGHINRLHWKSPEAEPAPDKVPEGGLDSGPTPWNGVGLRQTR
jgi:hypothetical protein